MIAFIDDHRRCGLHRCSGDHRGAGGRAGCHHHWGSIGGAGQYRTGHHGHGRRGGHHHRCPACTGIHQHGSFGGVGRTGQRQGSAQQGQGCFFHGKLPASQQKAHCGQAIALTVCTCGKAAFGLRKPAAPCVVNRSTGLGFVHKNATGLHRTPAPHGLQFPVHSPINGR